jgi:hypothetical protein
MEIHKFLYLYKESKEIYHLRGAIKLTVEKLVAIFLNTLGYWFGNRIVQDRFQHSGKTIIFYLCFNGCFKNDD